MKERKNLQEKSVTLLKWKVFRYRNDKKNVRKMIQRLENKAIKGSFA